MIFFKNYDRIKMCSNINFLTKIVTDRSVENVYKICSAFCLNNIDAKIMSINVQENREDHLLIEIKATGKTSFEIECCVSELEFFSETINVKNTPSGIIGPSRNLYLKNLI
jgi:hypothetical protein